jgi:phosphohistidine phosphatase
MQLILLRHGKADDHNPDGDFSRALTDKGREQARRAARLLKSAGMLPDLVLTSPLVRTRQTAEEFCKTAEIPGAITQSWLSCGCTPKTLFTELASYRDFKRVMIVGHEPDLSEIIETTIAAADYTIQMKKGALACLEIMPPAHRGSLLFLIPPKLADA